MAAITAKMVNELRAKTGAGMMECKKALVETDGNFDEAIKVLRERGLAVAAKKADRVAADGIVDVYTANGCTAIIEVNTETDFVAKGDMFKSIVHDIALHIAASNPLYVTKEEVPADVIEKEKAILRAQALEEGKPEKIVDKMVEGRIKSFYEDNCLLCQKFVKDPDKTIEQLVVEATATIGEKISIRRFVRFEMGEGLQKKEENFADEIAAQVEAMKK